MADFKSAIVDAFNENGRAFVDKIGGQYKDLGEEKLKLGKKFATLLFDNGKDYVSGKIDKKLHDQNVNDLWNAEKSDTLATVLEQKKSVIKSFIDGLGILADMAVGVISKILP
jgi:hypothetical protein